MEQKAFIRLLILLLGLSYVVFAAAVPATRSLTSGKVDLSVQDHLHQEDLDLRTGEEEVGVEDGRILMVNIADYPGTKSNPAHDPRNHP